MHISDILLREGRAGFGQGEHCKKTTTKKMGLVNLTLDQLTNIKKNGHKALVFVLLSMQYNGNKVDILLE